MPRRCWRKDRKTGLRQSSQLLVPRRSVPSAPARARPSVTSPPAVLTPPRARHPPIASMPPATLSPSPIRPELAILSSGPQPSLPIGCVERDVSCDLPLPAVAVGEEAILVIVEFFA